jgi:tryptophanyl-tRNA synthetase
MFTGLQPSGALHIGNYFGALKPAVELAKDLDSMVMIADLHALTTLKDPAALKAHIISGVKDYIGAGLDPAQTIIFQQSQVQEHTELAWIFECLVTVPFLQQAHAYKDKTAKGLEANAGLFNYPMLMAADILLYETDIVPVGADQRQHVEYAREAAAKFNNAYGDTFKEPSEHILDTVGTIPGTDGKKMSKSYGNTIPLFGTKDEIAKAVMGIVTDSGPIKGGDWGDPEHVYAIHKLFKTEGELAPIYEANKGKYKNLKEALIEDIEALIAPMRTRRDAVSDADVSRILTEGSDKAREIAQKTMQIVRERVGIAL